MQQIEFLDALVYIDNNNHLETTLYRKATDHQNHLTIYIQSQLVFLHFKTALDQTLQTKRICSTEKMLNKYSSNLLKQLVKKD